MLELFPKDCWNKHCSHFEYWSMGIDDLACSCDLIGITCEAYDQSVRLNCPQSTPVLNS